MTRAEYLRMTSRELKGRKVVTNHELSNGHGRISAGTVLTIYGKGGGLKLESDRCDKCGVTVFITKVPFWDVELLPINPAPSPLGGMHPSETFP